MRPPLPVLACPRALFLSAFVSLLVFATFAPAAAEAEPSAAAFYGVIGTQRLGNPAEAAEFQQLGIHKSRVDFNWANAKGSSCSNVDYEHYDSLVLDAAEHDITLVPVLTGNCPLDGTSKKYAFPTPSSNLTTYPDWLNFVEHLVARYGPGGELWEETEVSPHPITVWEVGNEENVARNNPAKFSGEQEIFPEKYANFLIDTSQAIKGKSPGATVLIGGLAVAGWQIPEGTEAAPTVLAFLEAMYNNNPESGAEAYTDGELHAAYDGLAIHPYALGETLNEERKLPVFEERVEDARNALNDDGAPGGDNGKSLAVTELGWPVYGVNGVSVGVGEQEQADNIYSAFSWLRRNADSLNILYAVVWISKDWAPQEPPYSWEQNAGLKRADGSTRESYCALSYLTGTKLCQYLPVKSFPTTVFITIPEGGVLDGQPGHLTVTGAVTSEVGAFSLEGKVVNVNYQKEVSPNNWSTMSSSHPVINSESRYYERDWTVTPGNWRVRVVLPAQDGFQEGISEYRYPTVHKGTRLIAKHSGKCLDVYGNSTANGQAVHQWECLNPDTSQNQVFTLVPQGNYYQIVPRHSGRCVDVTNASNAIGAPVQQFTCQGANQANQLWILVPVGGGYFNLVAKHSAQCLHVSEGRMDNGAPVQQWPCLGSGQTNQLWRMEPVDPGPIPAHVSISGFGVLHGQPGYATVSGHVDVGAYPISGQWLNVNYQKEVSPGTWQTLSSGHPTLDGNDDFLDPAHGVSVGNWRFRAVYPGSGNIGEGVSEYKYFTVHHGYHLVSRHSNKCMAVSANSQSNGAAILQWTCTPGTDPADGYTFSIRPVAGGYNEIRVNPRSAAEQSEPKCLDVTGASTENGTKLQQYPCASEAHPNQLWQLVQIQGQPYIGLVAKHSGKCADVEGASSENGARIQQWDCSWSGNQQWGVSIVN